MKNKKDNVNKDNSNLPTSNANQSLSKKDIERQIKGYTGLRNMAKNHKEDETVKKFDKLIDELKIELNKLNCA